MAVVQGVYQLNRDAPLTSMSVSAPGTFTTTITRGISLRASWLDIEPTEGNFVWTTWDKDIASAVTAGKRVFLRVWTCVNGGVDPPAWALSSGAQIFHYTSSKGGTQPVLVPWDSIFITKWKALIAAMGVKYANHPQVDCIMMAGLDITGGEMHLTGATTATDQTNWFASPYLYTPTKLINAWKTIIDAYVAAFPDKKLGLNVSTPISSTDGVVEAVVDYAASACAYGHLMVQTNVLAKKIAVLSTSTPQKWLNRAKGKNAIMGYQELCTANTAAGGDRWRGDTQGVPASPADMAAAFILGTADAQGPAVYNEAYPGNIFQATYASAYTTYFPNYSGPILIDDFATNRLTVDGTQPLWKPYTGAGQTQSGGYSSSHHDYELNVTGVGPSSSNGYYLYFWARGDTDNASYPNFWTQTYCQAAGFKPTYNRLQFRLTCNGAIPGTAPGENMEFGNYAKGHSMPDISYQGFHFYWQSGVGWEANEPVYVFLDPQVQHSVGGNSNLNLTYDQSWLNSAAWVFSTPVFPQPIRFMDALTQWYLDGSPNGGSVTLGKTFSLDDVYFDAFDETSEPFAFVKGTSDAAPVLMKQVSTITVTYLPSAHSGQGAYQLTWACPVNMNPVLTYRVYYGTVSMKLNGLASGTLDSQIISTSGDAFTQAKWVSPALPRGNYWFAIKPVSNNPRNYFSEVPYTNIATSGTAPVITSASSTTFTVGTAGTFTATATGNPVPSFSETGSLPSGVSLNSSTGVLSGTPGAGTGKVYTISLTASNGVSPNAIQTFTLTVNQAPAITSANTGTFAVGTAGTFTITATGYPAPTFSKTGTLPTGISLNGTTGVFSGTPAAATGGSYPLTLTATNGIGSDATQAFTLLVNQAPVITSANNKTMVVGTAGTFTVTATGFPAPTFSETGALPSGVTLNATTGVLAGTPGAGTGKVYTISITASNGVSPSSIQTFTLTVNQAPAITSANTTTFTVGAAGSFTVTATGFPAPTFSKTGALPTGVTLNATTGVLSGTPAAATGGSYPITITATNSIGVDATQSFTLIVDQAPVITSANNTTFTVGTPGTFTATATGYPAPTFTETGALPSGVTLNASTGVLSGTPAAGTGKAYSISITASNGVSPSSIQTFTLTVDQAPAITSANAATFTVGTAGTFTVIATGFPAPTFSKTGSLPTGVSLNATTGVISGTPGAGTGGSYPITITATNSIGSDATQSFTLIVNQAPAITSANNTAFKVGTAGSFSVTATGYPAPTFTKTGTLPSGVSLASDGTLAGTPGAGTGGVYSITLTATNGVGSNATQSFTLTVNQAPAITSANAASFVESTAGSFTVAASGYPAPTFSKTGSLPSGVSLNGTTGVLSGTPAAATAGSYPITITATNAITPDATQNFTLTVVAATVAPTITSANSTTFATGVAGSFQATATGTQPITWSETGSLPSGVTLSSTGLLSGTPGAATAGSYPITLKAANGTAPDATQAFTLTVTNSGVAPTITSADNAAFKVGTAGSFQATATGTATITWSKTGSLPSGVTLSSSGLISGTPGAGTAGIYVITLTATNGVSPDDTQQFSLTVNQAPAITSASSTTFTVGAAGSFQATATGSPAPTFSKTGSLPSGVTFSATGLLSGTPDAGTGGSYSITITATNAITPDATQSFTLQVDQAPVITSANTKTMTVGTAGTFTVTASGYPAPTFSQTGTLPTGVTLNATTGVLSGTPAALQGGVYALVLIADNEVAGTATQSFTLTVNEAPAITSATSTSFEVGVAGTFTVTASGYPAPTFSKTGLLPSAVTLDGTSGVLSGTPDAATGGSYPLTLTATNSIGSNATQSFTLAVDQAPAITSTNSKTMVVGTPGTFTVTATGYPAPTFSETGPLPTGVTLNATTGVLSGTPAALQGGVYAITLAADNEVPGTDTQSFTLTVNEAPAITSADNTLFAESTAGTFTVTASGYPAPTFSETGSLPSAVTLDADTGILSGTPDAGTGGDYPIVLTATNGIGSDATQNFTLSVDQAPAITSADHATFTVGTPGTFTVTATGSPAPTFTKTGSLPADVTLNATTGVISGTPATGMGGVYALVLTADNEVPGTATQAFTLTVNEAPAITSANTISFQIGVVEAFTVTATGYPAPTFSETGSLPSGITLDASTGVLGGTPGIGTGGDYPLTLTATNSIGADATQGFTLHIGVVPILTSADHATVTVGSHSVFQLTASGDTPITFSKNSLIPVGLELTPDGMLSGEAITDDGGVYPLVMIATNFFGSGFQDFTLTVNQIPVVTSASRTTFKKNVSGSFTFTASGYPASTWSITSLPTGLSLDPVTGIISGSSSQVGAFNLIVTATNDVGPATQAFLLTVGGGKHLSDRAIRHLLSATCNQDVTDEIVLAIETNLALSQVAKTVLADAICDNDVMLQIAAAIPVNGVLADHVERVLIAALCDPESAQEIITAIQGVE